MDSSGSLGVNLAGVKVATNIPQLIANEAAVLSKRDKQSSIAPFLVESTQTPPSQKTKLAGFNCQNVGRV